MEFYRRLELIKVTLQSWKEKQRPLDAKALANNVEYMIEEIERLEREAQDRKDFDNARLYHNAVRSGYRMRPY